MVPVPDYIRTCRTEDVLAQRIQWNPMPWEEVFIGHTRLLDELASHVAESEGIARAFVHERAGEDPVELFLLAMTWGWGLVGYGPTRVANILRQQEAAAKLGRIVEAARSHGAAAGWTALLDSDRLPGLGMAFGTKLLYFAAFTVDQLPKPLILDAIVREALQSAAPGTVPRAGKTVWRDDYVRYLALAADWAADPTWNQPPDVVEYGLFSQGGRRRPDSNADATDGDAQP